MLGVCVAVGVWVGVTGVLVGVDVGVWVGVTGVLVGVDVFVGVAVGVLVAEGVDVFVGVAVGVLVAGCGGLDYQMGYPDRELVCAWFERRR